MLEIDRIELNFREKMPLYLQLAEQLRLQIESGQLQPDEQLPPVRELAEKLRINFNTVARAYRVLDIEGWISTQQGRGTYISMPTWPRVGQLAPAPPPPADDAPDDNDSDSSEPEPVATTNETLDQLQIQNVLVQAAAEGISAQMLLAYLLEKEAREGSSAESSGRVSREPVTPRHPRLRTHKRHRRHSLKPVIAIEHNAAETDKNKVVILQNRQARKPAKRFTRGKTARSIKRASR